MSETVRQVSFPRRGNRLSQALGRLWLRLTGWTIEGEVPDVPKAVHVAAPHTSNWDFIYCISAVLALRLHFNWVGKHTLFRFPLGPLMRFLGGIPIKRGSGQGMVDATIEEMKERARFLVGIAPEGTRKHVDRWRTGFYRIAVGAGVPIVLCSCDYRRKVVGIGPTFEPSGDWEADLEPIRAYYRAISGRHPEQFGMP